MIMVTRNLCVVTTLDIYLSQSILCVERTKSGSNQHKRFDVEVEVFTGSVKCFSRKMHKAPEITGQN
jgi:hypothetical protein